MKEKSADEMFKELGYKISEEVSKEKDKYGCGIQFKKETGSLTIYIEFYYYHKQICVYIEQEILKQNIRWKCVHLSVEELQAINKKCQELGWLDE